MIDRPVAMRDALLLDVYERMSSNKNIFFLTADFGSPVLDKIRSDFGSRFLNVGIAEQNLINVSVGLALEGFTVFAYAIAPFITMRCLEQSRVSLAILSQLRDLNVNLIGVGAGYSYVMSGPTHQCYEDISVMRSLPSFSVISPSDHSVCSKLAGKCVNEKGVKYLRLDAQALPAIERGVEDVFKNGFRCLREGSDGVVVATGYMVHCALEVIEKLRLESLDLGLIDIVDLTGFNEHLLGEMIRANKTLFSLEEGFSGRGGLDSLLRDFLYRHDIEVQVHGIGVKPKYDFELGSRSELHELAGIGPNAIISQVKRIIGNKGKISL